MNQDDPEPSERESAGPPPIPASYLASPREHQPPPIPEEVLSFAGSFGGPPPIPGAYAPTSGVQADEQLRGNHTPPPIPAAAVPDFPVSVAGSRMMPEPPVKIMVSAPVHHQPVILSRVALALTLLCVPLALMGSFWPLLRSPFWIAALVLAFLAYSLAKFTLSNPEASPALARLTLRLSYGFILISMIGLIAAAFRASIFLSATVDRASAAIHAAADAQQGANATLSWFLHKIDVIIQFFSSHSPPPGTVHPSPTPSP